MKHMKIVHLLFLWLLIANLVDLVITVIGVHIPNIYEANPTVVYIMNINFLLFVGIKIALPTLVAIGLLVTHGMCKRWINKLIIEITLTVLAIDFTICIINNILVIAKCL